MSERRPALDRGSLVGRHVIVERVGVGGFGEVYAAYDPELDRKVALKLMKTRSNRLGSARVQLLREAQALAKLSHENVLTIFDFGEFADDVYISMEFVDGYTLKQWFRAEPRGWQDVRDVMVAAGRGLAAAHAAGIIHSDFKPQNVLVDRRGRVAVADFGLAKALQQEDDDLLRPDDWDAQFLRRRTNTIPTVRNGEAKVGQGREPLAGSPAYMAPEQFTGGPISERTDQFSFCVALFEGLYGQRPFPQKTFTELRLAIEDGVITDPSDERGVPRWIRNVVYRGLSRNPLERFESMDELLAALSLDPHLRRAQRKALVITGVASAAAALVVSLVLRREPSLEELGRIDSLVLEAQAAAAKSFFVHPPVETPRHPTAYTKILELEELDGVYDPQADERARDLRNEFAQTLLRLGDYYWEADYGVPFAFDYYEQALIFEPTNSHALARTTATAGQRAALREKAATLSFTERELIAAEPLAALAASRIAERIERLHRLESKKRKRSVTSEAALDFVSRVTDEMAKMTPKGEASAIHPFSPPLPDLHSELVQRLTRDVPPSTAVQRGEETDANKKAAQSSASPERRDPGVAEALVQEGRSLYKHGKLESAAQAFHRALREDNKSASALMGLCDVYFEQGDYHKAVEYGKRGVALSPRRATYRISLGDAYHKILEYGEAMSQYEIASRQGSKLAKRRIRDLSRKMGE